MVMKKLTGLLIFLGVCISLAGHAQNGVVTAGTDLSGAGGTIAFSMGQIAYTYIDGEAGKVHQGIQQPQLSVMVEVKDLYARLPVTVYPNPVQTALYISFGRSPEWGSPEDFSYRLMDMQGKVILQRDLNSLTTLVPMASLPEAVYLLQIQSNSTDIKSFMVIKTK